MDFIKKGTFRKSSYVYIIFALFGIMLQAVYYFTGLAYAFPEYVLVCLAIVVIPTTICILFFQFNKYLIFFLVLFTALFVNMTYWYYSQSLPYIPPLDAIYHWKTSEGIIKTSQIQAIGPIHSIESSYSNSPGFHLFISMASMITGVDSVTFVKLSPLVYSLLPFLMYIISKRFFKSERIAWMASFITIFLPKWYSFPSYNRFVFIYLLLFFLFLHELTVSPRKTQLITASILMFSISMTHHVTNYITLASLIFLFAFTYLARGSIRGVLPFLKKAKTNKLTSRSAICLFISGLLFPVYVAFDLSRHQLSSFVKYLSPRYRAPEFSISIMGYYPEFQRVFILGTVILVFIIGLVGFLYYLRGRAHSQWAITPVVFVTYIGLLLALSLPLMNVNASITHYVQYRGVFVVFLVLAPFIGYSLNRFFHVKTRARRDFLNLGVIVLLLLSLAISSTLLWPRSYYDFSAEERSGFLWEVRNYSNSLYSSLHWYKEGVPQNSKAVGDVPIYDIGRGMLNLSVEYYWPLYEEPTMDNEHIEQLRYIGAKYVFVDQLMTAYKEQHSFGMVKEPVSASNLEYLTSSKWSTKVYDNALISILFVDSNPYPHS